MQLKTVSAAIAAALTLAPAAGSAACRDAVVAFVHGEAYAAGMEAATPLAQRVTRRQIASATWFANTEREAACETMLQTAIRTLENNDLARIIGGWDMEGGLTEIDDAAIDRALAEVRTAAGEMGTPEVPENAPRPDQVETSEGM